MDDLFGPVAPMYPPKEAMAEGAVLLRGTALPFEKMVLAALSEIATVSPFRHMITPGGFTMSVAMTNCGTAGWVTDRAGYRYDRIDPETGNCWPPMPGCFLGLAGLAAVTPAIRGFVPMHARSTAMSLVRVCRSTRTRTSATSPVRSCRCRWVCRRHSSSAA